MVSSVQQERVSELLAQYATSPELELQQRAVEFVSLFNLGDVKEGVLEKMPPPELKATVIGTGKCRRVTCSILRLTSLQLLRLCNTIMSSHASP